MERRKSRQIVAGSVKIGGGAEIPVQSMLSVSSADIAGSVAQARALEAAGCQLLRIAIPDREAVRRLIPAVKEAVRIPAVADGSLEKHILAKYGHPTPEALADSALYHASLLEKFDFTDIVLSMKASSVERTMQAYQIVAQRCDYPLHLGITHAGTARMGLVKSAIGIGGLLQQGIGDTLRVSLTADPVEEVRAGGDILRALGLRRGVKLIACPTCGRTRIDLIPLANQVEAALAGCQKDITVAVMGCAVNGPGEAREADVGIAGGKGEGLIFRKGEILRKVPEARLLDELLAEVARL